MAFMVKNPGLIPGLDSLKSGDVTKRRKGMWDILLGCWKSCQQSFDFFPIIFSIGHKLTNSTKLRC